MDLEPDLITAYATAATAFATAVLAALTLLLALENRRLRQVSSAPRVVPYLSAHPEGHGGVNFVLHNVGAGPALDVSFRLINDDKDFEAHETMLKNDPERTATSVLPQGASLSILFGVGYVLFGGDAESSRRLKPFQVEVTYSSLSGKAVKSIHTLDISQFSGLAGVVSKPTVVKIAELLSKIEQHLSTISGRVAYQVPLADTTRLSDNHRRVHKAGHGRDAKT